MVLTLTTLLVEEKCLKHFLGEQLTSPIDVKAVSLIHKGVSGTNIVHSAPQVKVM